MNHHIAAGIMAQSRNSHSHSHSRYPATSSAFSASAHPHEDWTKISDLAERRRIQNRIAQRNYRKKLKKRLEDLEAKAASTSASPEQQPAQLPQRPSNRKKSSNASATGSLSASPQKPVGMSPQPAHQRSLSGMISLPEGALFADQYSRNISTSPPPALSYPMTTSDAFAFGAFTTSMHYPSTTANYNPLDYSYNPYPSAYDNASTVPFPAKTDFYLDIDSNALSFQYTAGSVTALDSNSYSESAPQTPPLSDCHELYIAGSPSDSSLLPQTPPMAFATSPILTMV